jgi:hypothetical protein
MNVDVPLSLLRLVVGPLRRRETIHFLS